ncbi:membrane protein [Croceibacterium mercuriale]|uniref:Membrane protein n=1 Tax=Croceibacterium mercuriale TaxID=1572751 RepID=A0A0B2BT52_9SPHN|nr:DUF445 domain-containing protein [Croceibacterium mercuriale]KHL24614.1 membrane protein [Croceibacterium mercuriale]
MRATATALLVAMAGLFALAHLMERAGGHPAWGWLSAFAEAAMVGGLADWFAVTALFRHPLGLPIPHTAIIPRNKDRIADTMAGFLRTNFLTPAVIARRLHGANPARMLGEFLQRPRAERGAGLRAGVAGLLADVLESLDPQALGEQVRHVLAKQAGRLELSPMIGHALGAMIAGGRHRPLMDMLIRWLGGVLEGNEALVRRMVSDRAGSVIRWTGLDEKLGSSVVDGLYRMLAELLIDPDHPLRAKVDDSLAKLAHDLVHDPATRAKVEAAKARVLANPAAAEWWMGVWERLRTGLIAAARDPAGSGSLDTTLAELGRGLSEDPRLQLQVNRFARRTAVGVASRYGGGIVALVSDTVKRWDANTVTARIEGAVGRDLQFIRINGTLVGGLVGLTLHAITQAL